MEFENLVPKRSSRCVDRLFFSNRRASTFRMLGKSPFLFLSPLSLSVSLPDFFSFLPLFASLTFFLLFSSFLIHRTYPFLFAHTLFPFPFLFLFSFIFSSHSFSLIFLFLPFLFSISHLDCINRMVEKWGKLPPTFLHCHLSSPQFLS